MMSQVIRQETAVFLISILHGIGLTFIYDVIRALRRTWDHGLAAVSAEDFLFWMAAGFLTFCLAFSRTDGVIRGYVAAGIFLGVILYHFTVSSLVVTVFSKIFQFVRGVFCLFLRILSGPARFFCSFLKKVIEFIGKKGYNKFNKKIRGNCHGKKKKARQQEQS